VGKKYYRGVVFYNGTNEYKLKNIRVLNPLIHGGVESAL